eukprot:TRINITY_DN7006_c0_g1_i1.p1 TRINITY_DN7006_c0_g1~~TRINITY_DN7006_c0_g1_i1.p1  ORF type:complete len:367 (-),score=38.75 TRINITY_DN7006_c0_g1_i1:32-1132(-)
MGAEDMASLYKKVLKGIYPKIPSTYSQDLASMVKHLLHVSPHLRPNCDQILKLPIVLNKIDKLFPSEELEDMESNQLINKIRIPRNLLSLSDKLPKPQYELGSPDMLKRNATNVADSSLPSIATEKRPRQMKAKRQYVLGSINKYRVKRGDEPQPDIASMLPSTKARRAPKPNEQVSPRVDKVDQVQPKSPEIAEKEEVKLAPIRREKKPLGAGYKPRYKRANPNKEYEGYINDLYIEQLVSKRNPIVRQGNDHMQQISEIYSGLRGARVPPAQRYDKNRLLEIERRGKQYLGKLPKIVYKSHIYGASPYYHSAVGHQKLPQYPASLQSKAGKLSLPSSLKANRLLPPPEVRGKNPSMHRDVPDQK